MAVAERRKLCVIPGDGIGQEVIPAAVDVLSRVLPGLETVPAEAGWGCFQRTGQAVPEATLRAVRECGAGLFGAVSSPSEKVPGYRSAILTLRQELGLYANLRPVRSLPGISPSGREVNLLVVRENSEGLYAGRERQEGERAVAERVITGAASRRIGRAAVRAAHRGGFRRVCIVHKANILPLTDGLFRSSVREAARAYAEETGWEAQLSEMLVDTAAMHLAGEPERFEVIVTTNLFGDILSDVAAVWCGGLGYAPSLNLGEQAAIAEPVHGSAPDIAGTGKANPAAAILSAALLVKWAWQLAEPAGRIEQAVREAAQAGELGPGASTAGVTRAVLARL